MLLPVSFCIASYWWVLLMLLLFLFPLPSALFDAFPGDVVVWGLGCLRVRWSHAQRPTSQFEWLCTSIAGPMLGTHAGHFSKAHLALPTKGKGQKRSTLNPNLGLHSDGLFRKVRKGVANQELFLKPDTIKTYAVFHETYHPNFFTSNFARLTCLNESNHSPKLHCHNTSNF